MSLANNLAFLFYVKFAVALSYLGCCGTTNSVLLLASYFFDNIELFTLGLVVTRFNVWYTLRTILFGGDGTYRFRRILKFVGDIQQLVVHS